MLSLRLLPDLPTGVRIPAGITFIRHQSADRPATRRSASARIQPSRPPSLAVPLFRRLAALLSTLLLFQSPWQVSGVACADEHMSMHAGMASDQHVQVDGAPAETEQTSHCPDSGMPADCAAMRTCSAAPASLAAAPLLTTDGRRVSERVVAPDAFPRSLDVVPDVPPPRA